MDTPDPGAARPGRLVQAGHPASAGDHQDILPADRTVYVTPAPDANTALSTFLDAQLAENYPIMYRAAPKASQSAINEADLPSATPTHWTR